MNTIHKLTAPLALISIALRLWVGYFMETTSGRANLLNGFSAVFLILASLLFLAGIINKYSKRAKT